MPRKQKEKHYVTTRKDHVCHSCGDIIPKGTWVPIYHSFTGETEYYHPLPEGCPKFNKRKE